jgi:hypothetical protein
MKRKKRPFVVSFRRSKTFHPRSTGSREFFLLVLPNYNNICKGAFEIHFGSFNKIMVAHVFKVC